MGYVTNEQEYVDHFLNSHIYTTTTYPTCGIAFGMLLLYTSSMCTIFCISKEYWANLQELFSPDVKEINQKTLPSKQKTYNNHLFNGKDLLLRPLPLSLY